MDGEQDGSGGEFTGGDGIGAYYAGEVKTPFATAEDVDSMKAMLVDAKPEQVLDVAGAWERIHDHLVNGGGSIKGDFDRTVEHVLRHWEGESADAFARVAAKISKQLADCGTYARYTSAAMRNAGERLSEVKPKIEAVGKRGDLGGAVNRVGGAFMGGGGRKPDGGFGSFGGFRGDLGERRAAAHDHDRGGESGGESGDSSGGKDERAEAVALMVDLALTYNSQTRAMSSWQRKLPPRYGGEAGEYPGEPGGVAPNPGPIGPGEPAPGAAAVAAARAAGAASVGTGVPKPGRPAADRTSAAAAKGAPMRVDGVSGGTATTAPSAGGTGPAAPAGGASGGITRAVPGGVTGAAPGGVTGALHGGGRGPGSGSGGVAGGIAGRRGASGSALGEQGTLGSGVRTSSGSGSGDGVGRGKGGGAGAGLPAGLGAGAGPGSGAAGAGAGGRSAEAAAGRGLHFSRGGTLSEARGRSGSGVLGGALGMGGLLADSRDGVPGKYSRRRQDDGTAGPHPYNPGGDQGHDT